MVRKNRAPKNRPRVTALLLGSLELPATELSSSSKSEYHLCVNMKNLLLQMCNNWSAYARACAMEAQAAEAARELRKEHAGAHRLSGLPMGQAFDTSGPGSTAGSDAAKRDGAGARADRARTHHLEPLRRNERSARVLARMAVHRL